MGEALRIVLNGEEARVAAGTTLAQLLDRFVKDRARVAVERNRAIVPRARYAEEPVHDGDVIEIVTLAGGG